VPAHVVAAIKAHDKRSSHQVAHGSHVSGIPISLLARDSTERATLGPFRRRKFDERATKVRSLDVARDPSRIKDARIVTRYRRFNEERRDPMIARRTRRLIYSHGRVSSAIVQRRVYITMLNGRAWILLSSISSKKQYSRTLITLSIISISNRNARKYYRQVYIFFPHGGTGISL